MNTTPALTPTSGRPWGAIFVAISGFLLISMRQNMTVPMSLGLSLGQFLLFGSGLLWVLTRLSGQRSRISNPILTIVVMCYFAAVWLTYAAATGAGLTPKAAEFSGQYNYVTVGLVMMVGAVMSLLTTADDVRLALKGLLVGGAVSSGFALVQSATGLDLAASFKLPGLKTSDFILVKDLMREGIVRSQGSAGHPLELAVVLTILIPIGVGVIGSARAKHDRIWPWVLCTGVVALGALSTVSRSVVLGLAAATVVMCWRWRVTRLAATLGGLLLAVGAGWLLQLRIATALAASFAVVSDDPSIESRSTGRGYVLTHYQEHFWVGTGMGTYPAVPNQPVLDNEYFSRLMEGGVVGLICYTLVLITAIVLAIRASAAPSPVLAELGGGISGALAVVIATSAILDMGGFAQVTTLIWLIVAMAGVVAYLARHGDLPPVDTGRAEIQCVDASRSSL